MTRKEDRDPVPDTDLMAYVDGTLPPEKTAEVEARLARDAYARDAVAQWRHFDNLIHDAARTADTQPANLRIAALERELARKLQRRRRWAILTGPRLRQVAASAVIFAAGWGAHALYDRGASMMNGAYPGFVSQTLAGHYSYTLAAHERAAFGGDQMADALAWLSEEMQQRIESPKLERLGYRVESARLMVVDEEPVAVFYYRNPEDERVTVSMTPRRATQPDYELRVARVQDERMAYWTSDRLHYTVVTSSTETPVTTLAAAVQE